ncbi:MAG: zf-HC2 domain-containing protein [Phycisphaerae bacterium]
MSPPCQWVRSVLVAYLDGELRPSTAEAVRRHLARCESCRAQLRLLQESWRLLDEMPPAPVRSGFTERMMARVVEEKDLSRFAARLAPHERRRNAIASVLGVAAGLVFGFAVYAWTGSAETPASPVECEVSRHVSFLEDVDLLDEVAVIQAMDHLDRDPDDAPDADEPDGA